MNFELRAHQVDLVNAVRAHVEKLLQSKLGPHAEYVRKLKLRLTQQDSANSDAPKLCFLAAELVPSGKLIVMETSRDLFMAVSRAIARFKKALRRKVQRQRSMRRSRESVRNPIS
jgi:ribosome-associated translation inhibitor RaiA